MGITPPGVPAAPTSASGYLSASSSGHPLRAISDPFPQPGHGAGIQHAGPDTQRAAPVSMLFLSQAWVSESACSGVMGSTM